MVGPQSQHKVGVRSWLIGSWEGKKKSAGDPDGPSISVHHLPGRSLGSECGDHTRGRIFEAGHCNCLSTIASRAEHPKVMNSEALKL